MSSKYILAQTIGVPIHNVDETNKIVMESYILTKDLDEVLSKSQQIFGTEKHPDKVHDLSVWAEQPTKECTHSAFVVGIKPIDPAVPKNEIEKMLNIYSVGSKDLALLDLLKRILEHGVRP